MLWKIRTGGPFHSTPGVAGGLAFVAGCDEVFRAIRIADGKELFSVSSGYTGASPRCATASILRHFDNEVLMVSLQSRNIFVVINIRNAVSILFNGSGARRPRCSWWRDKLLHALDTAGKEVWTFTTRARIESSPAIAGGRVYFGSNDGRFYVLNLSDGAKVWEFNAGAPLSASPAIANGRVVIGAQDGKLYCFG